MKKVHFLHTIALLSLSLTGKSYCAAENQAQAQAAQAAQEANSGWVSSAANAAYNLLPSWPSWRSAPAPQEVAPAPAEQVAPTQQPVAPQYVPSVNEFEFELLKRRMRAIDKEHAEREERERQKNLE